MTAKPFIYKIMLMPPGQQNQYDFIMSNAPQKRGPAFGNSPRARIAIVAGGLILLIIIAMVVMSFFSQGDKVQTQRLIEVAQAQNEIIRVSSLGKEKARDINTRSLAANARLSVESSQVEVKAALGKRGVKSKSLNKTLAASKNTKTDDALNEASQNNRFDDTFTLVMQKQLEDYRKLLMGAYDSGTATEKKVLKTSFDSAGKLVAKPTATAQ